MIIKQESKIEGIGSEDESEKGFIAMFAFLQGVVTKHADVFPMLAVILFQVAALRAGHKMVDKDGWLSHELMKGHQQS